MKLRNLSIAALASGVAFMAQAADQSADQSAAATADAQATLEQRLLRAEERIRVLERRLELADELRALDDTHPPRGDFLTNATSACEHHATPP